ERVRYQPSQDDLEDPPRRVTLIRQAVPAINRLQLPYLRHRSTSLISSQPAVLPLESLAFHITGSLDPLQVRVVRLREPERTHLRSELREVHVGLPLHDRRARVRPPARRDT